MNEMPHWLEDSLDEVWQTRRAITNRAERMTAMRAQVEGQG